MKADPAVLVCPACYRQCRLSPGQTGFCGVRRHDGEAVTNAFPDQVLALALDPVEKKPLYHAFPGREVLSVALGGCNFRCRFCQNAAIAWPEHPRFPAGRTMSPAAFAREAARLAADQGAPPLAAYTYSEPTVWQDWMLAAAGEVKQLGGHNLLVSNGSFGRGCRKALAGLIDACNIDLKGDAAFYRDLCRAEQAPVLENIATLVREGAVHVEVTTLLIEGVQSRESVLELGRWLAETGVQVWHLSRFYPAAEMMDYPPTSLAWQREMVAAARERCGVPFVYGGEVQGSFCPGCGGLLVERRGPGIPVAREIRLRRDSAGTVRCPGCGAGLPFVLGDV